MNKTPIEWTDYTWNPITGCKNKCPYCYAEKIAKRFFKQGFEPTFYPERLTEKFPKKPSRIFVCSMADLFGGWNPDWQVKAVLDTIKLYPEHTFQLLTKQPQNLIKFSPFPDNCWVGVSVTNPNQLAHAINGLALVEAKVKYYSFEPLLERMIGYTQPIHPNHLADIQWAIIGAQTKPTVMPKKEWVQEIVEACDKASIPVFLKDSLFGPGRLFQNDMDSRRQEMP